MAGSLKDIDYSVLQQCMHCGMCLPTCPTYDATTRERNSPRGRIALMRAVADGELEVGPAFADEMSYCLGCLACQTACPAGVHYGELLETARTEIERAHVDRSFSRRFWRTVSLRVLFMHPRLLRAAGLVLRWYQRTGMEAFVRRLGLTRLLPPALARLEPYTPRMAPAFSPALIAPHEEPAYNGIRRRVALLTGCMQDLIFPTINRDTADVLLANGCAVDTPALQPCCGSLHAHNGERDLARQLARQLIDLIPPSKYDAIISNAGGCGSHLRQFAALLGDDEAYRERARAWDTKVRDIHEWLAEIGARAPDASPREDSVVVTYHESCHLAHGQRIVSQPRALLRSIPGVSLVELRESNWCCGSAGVYNITQPDQSAALLARKVGHVRATGAAILATSNPGCHLQIARGIREAGLNVEIVQPVTLLAEAYRRETDVLQSRSDPR
jgi:glycolate oxidase iron-sulfur subunit